VGGAASRRGVGVEAVASADSEPSPTGPSPAAAHGSAAALTLGALGVVFGDIGTSPLYAMKQTFSPEYGLTPDEGSVYGVL